MLDLLVSKYINKHDHFSTFWSLPHRDLGKAIYCASFSDVIRRTPVYCNCCENVVVFGSYSEHWFGDVLAKMTDHYRKAIE